MNVAVFPGTKPDLRLTLRRGATVLMLLTLASAAVAQPYPSRSIRMIVPAGPGGGVDTVARMVGQALSAVLGQPVVMDNRPGAGTMLASELTAVMRNDIKKWSKVTASLKLQMN